MSNSRISTNIGWIKFVVINSRVNWIIQQWNHSLIKIAVTQKVDRVFHDISPRQPLTVHEEIEDVCRLIVKTTEWVAAEFEG